MWFEASRKTKTRFSPTKECYHMEHLWEDNQTNTKEPRAVGTHTHSAQETWGSVIQKETFLRHPHICKPEDSVEWAPNARKHWLETLLMDNLLWRGPMIDMCDWTRTRPLPSCSVVLICFHDRGRSMKLHIIMLREDIRTSFTWPSGLYYISPCVPPHCFDTTILYICTHPNDFHFNKTLNDIATKEKKR